MLLASKWGHTVAFGSVSPYPFLTRSMRIPHTPVEARNPHPLPIEQTCIFTSLMERGVVSPWVYNKEYSHRSP